MVTRETPCLGACNGCTSEPFACDMGQGPNVMFSWWTKLLWCPAPQGRGVDGSVADSGAFQAGVDLSPYVNSSAPAVPEAFSLERAYRMFRQLGLRHLIVTDAHNHVKGILTRKVRACPLLLSPHALPPGPPRKRAQIRGRGKRAHAQLFTLLKSSHGIFNNAWMAVRRQCVISTLCLA